MASPIVDKLFELLQNLKTDATNLDRDLDEKDKREETKGDLRQLFRSFNELRTLISKMDESEKAKMQAEMQELMSGKENILEYNRDVANILINVKKRVEGRESIKEKVIEHLPQEQKNENVGTLFDNWRSVLTNVQQWIEQNSSHKIGSR